MYWGFHKSTSPQAARQLRLICHSELMKGGGRLGLQREESRKTKKSECLIRNVAWVTQKQCDIEGNFNKQALLSSFLSYCS